MSSRPSLLAVRTQPDLGPHSSPPQAPRAVGLTWMMIPFLLYSACSALENVHTKAWSKKENTPKGRACFVIGGNLLSVQRALQEAYLLDLLDQNVAVCLMGVRTLFLGLGKAPSMNRNVHFGNNTCRGPRHTGDPTQGELSPVSRPENVPSAEGLFLGLGHGDGWLGP